MKKIVASLLLLIIPAIIILGQELEYKKTVVFEEVASASCQGCPRGIVAMERMKEKYSDSFIGIVTHIKDPMAVSLYVNPLANEFITSYPTVIVNRKKDKVGDPNLSEEFYLKEIQTPVINALAIFAEYEKEETQRLEVTIHTKFAFSSANTNLKYAIVITENGVTGPSPGYDQVNGYAGGNTEMGGFELLPNPVPASQMIYQDVARGIFPEFKGTANNLPTSFEKDELLSFNYSFDLPDNILNKDSIEIIALILNGVTGEIVNAAKIPAPDSYPINNEIIAQNGLNANIYSGSTGIVVDIQSINNDKTIIEVFDIKGTVITRENVKTNGHYTLPVKRSSSIYIVKVSNGKDTIVRKVLN